MTKGTVAGNEVREVGDWETGVVTGPGFHRAHEQSPNMEVYRCLSDFRILPHVSIHIFHTA